MKNTEEFFNKYAYDFDALYGVPNNLLNRIINPIFRKSMKLRFGKTMEFVDPIQDKTIFDIGCGPGHYTIALIKAGAKKVVGIDFAEEMINIAKQKALNENVAEKCEFIVSNVFKYQTDEKFDYSILMGFMDYIEDPVRLINRVISLTKDKILFSFPKDEGILAAQRKLRYRKRCPLFLYKEKDLINLFSRFEPLDYRIEKIKRDFFVTLFIESK
jgi:2-polyprenyl-3-methyl-5-hydroxy-6-metoxy-1,4-benzoquinol methylase